jgi:hypothetical protein
MIAADGSYFTLVGDTAWALRHTKRNGKPQSQIRANVQIDAQSWVPQVISISGDDGESEPDAFAKDLQSGVLYIVDRNFVDFDFVNAVLARDNDFVLRVKANAPLRLVKQTLELTQADRDAGVVADELVELTGRDAPAGTFRLVTLQTIDRDGKPSTIRLLTSLLDARTIAAKVIGEVYRRRWQIELFFKWLKTFARMDHLLSASRNGVTLQLYIAVIGVLLMYVQSGRRVSVYALHQFALLARGQITLEQALQTIARRDCEREKERERLQRKRNEKKTG